MHSHTNFDKAVTLTRAVDAALLGDDTSDQKGVFDAIYATLETMEAHEACDHEEDDRIHAYHDQFADDELDEEEELELTDAGEAVIDLYDIEQEFSDFSPSVGTFEGTTDIGKMLEGYTSQTLREVKMAEIGGIKRAPVGERVYMERSKQPERGLSTAELLDGLYGPCGADWPCGAD